MSTAAVGPESGGIEPGPPASTSQDKSDKGRFASRLVGWLFTLMTLVAITVIAVLSLRQTQRVSAKSDRPVAQAHKGEFQVIVSCRGELVAGKSVLIAAPTNVPDLRITWIAPQGEPVKPGTPILRFDESGAKRQLQEKEATLGQAQASLDQAIAEARINEQKDNLDLAAAQQAIERAALDVQKAEIVSALQAAEYKLDLTLAQEKRRVQEATNGLNRVSAESKQASLRSQRDKAQAEVELTKKRIGQMTVVAPSEGVLTYLMNFSQGWVNARPFKIGDNVWAGSAVAEIPDLTTLNMKAKVEEMDRSRINISQRSRIVLDPFPEKQFAGKLVRVSSLTEQNFEWPPSRNFRAFASFEEVDKRLRPGMNGRLDIVVDRIANAISVPAKAVFTRNGRAVVLIPGEHGLKPVDVAVIARNPDEVAISGIAAGTTVALTDDLAKDKKP
jgi:multidrug efflux pump subunit AcrA (membrane-fusion protein)